MEEKLKRAYLTKNTCFIKSLNRHICSIDKTTKPAQKREDLSHFQIYWFVHFPTKIKKLAKKHS